MMLVQQMSPPPASPSSSQQTRAPEPIRPYHGRVNNQAPESVLQLNKSTWTTLQSTSPLTNTISASTATTTNTPPSLSSSHSSLPTAESIQTSKLSAPNDAGAPSSSSSSSTAFTIIPAKSADASQIRHIGSTVFANTFGFSIPPLDLASYLAESYSLASIQADLANPSHHFLVAVSGGADHTRSSSTAGRVCERDKNGQEGGYGTDLRHDGDDDALCVNEENQVEDQDQDEDEDVDREAQKQIQNQKQKQKQKRTIIGFAQVTQHTTEPCLSHLPQSSLVELQRLYVLPSYQNLGVGRALLAAAEEVARNRFATGSSRNSVGNTGSTSSTSSTRSTRSTRSTSRDLHHLRSTRAKSLDRYRHDANADANANANAKTHMWLGVWEGNFVAQNVYEKQGYERVGEHEFRMGRCVQIDWVMVKEL